MGLPTPADNLAGYEQGQLLNKADNIRTKGYYLIHGTLDDNVHYQQSLMLAKVLEQKDILFRQQVRTTMSETLEIPAVGSVQEPCRAFVVASALTL